MTESNLSDRIDRLAASKAMAWLRQVQKTIDEALKPFWWLKENDAGREFLGEVVRQVLTEYVRGIGSGREQFDDRKVDLTLVATEYRRAFLAEVLEKLPLVKELAMLQIEEPADEYRHT